MFHFGDCGAVCACCFLRAACMSAANHRKRRCASAQALQCGRRLSTAVAETPLTSTPRTHKQITIPTHLHSRTSSQAADELPATMRALMAVVFFLFIGLSASLSPVRAREGEWCRGVAERWHRAAAVPSHYYRHIRTHHPITHTQPPHTQSPQYAGVVPVSPLMDHMEMM